MREHTPLLSVVGARGYDDPSCSVDRWGKEVHVLFIPFLLSRLEPIDGLPTINTGKRHLIWSDPNHRTISAVEILELLNHVALKQRTTILQLAEGTPFRSWHTPQWVNVYIVDPTRRKYDQILAISAVIKVRREVLGTPTRTMTLAATTPISWTSESRLVRSRWIWYDIAMASKSCGAVNCFTPEMPSHHPVEPG